MNLPGEASSIVTTLDGYQMALQGRAGPALATAAIGSFFAGTVSTLIIALFAPPLAYAALKFGAAEYLSLMVLGLVGTDVSSGSQRYTFWVNEPMDGIGFITVAMGMFGLGQIIMNLGREGTGRRIVSKITSLMPTREDWKRMIAPILRGTILGSALGILPGGGPLLASFGSYSMEKKVSKYSAEFGKGAIEGVAGPESANNAGSRRQSPAKFVLTGLFRGSRF